MTRIEIVTIDGCPHAALAEARVREAVGTAGVPGAELSVRVVTTPEEAIGAGFAGSPTILLDGHDPFPSDGPSAALACRLYSTERGPEGAPSTEQIVAALARQR